MKPKGDVMHPMIYTAQTTVELISLWKEHRNDLTGLMASEEIMRRITSGRLKLLPTPNSMDVSKD